VYPEIPGKSAWWILFRPPWCCLLLWQLKIRTGLTKSWTSYIRDLPTSCRKFLYFTFLNRVKTEVLVCPVYSLHEYNVLHSSIRLPLFPYLFSRFSALCLQLLPHVALTFPIYVTWNAPVSPHSAADSHISV
jgi:hypothetical protein